MEVTKHLSTESHPADCAECGKPIVGPWYAVDGDAVCSRPDCGPAFAEIASPEGQARLAADRQARPAQYD